MTDRDILEYVQKAQEIYVAYDVDAWLINLAKAIAGYLAMSYAFKPLKALTGTTWKIVAYPFRSKPLPPEDPFVSTVKEAIASKHAILDEKERKLYAGPVVVEICYTGFPEEILVYGESIHNIVTPDQLAGIRESIARAVERIQKSNACQRRELLLARINESQMPIMSRVVPSGPGREKRA